MTFTHNDYLLVIHYNSSETVPISSILIVRMINTSLSIIPNLSFYN